MSERNRQCNPHPDAPHGFDRNASHNADRYVCECEGWESKQEPFCYHDGVNQVDAEFKDHSDVFPLYLAPPKRDLTCVCGAVWEGDQMVHAPRPREWVGLTDDDYEELLRTREWGVYLIEAVEAKLKEKNGG